MAKLAKALQAVTGTATAGGGALDITDVFSTYLYDGFSGTKTIVNGIDLLGEGGLTWTKRRDLATYTDHVLTSSGNGNLRTNTTAADSASSYAASGFRSDGFNVISAFGDRVTGNGNGQFVTWTFRKAPKFFDVVTYTGNGVGFPGPQISHNLQARPGWIVIKRTDSTGTWDVAAMHGPGHQFGDNIYYRYNTNSPFGFDSSNASASVSGLYPTYVSDTYFMPNLIGQYANISGATYVAYLFAHNDGDGEFGPSGDQDIIKCGSYTGNGNYLNGKYVDVGFEPQWILQKAASTTGPWLLLDTMRGWDVNTGNKPRLLANATNSEANSNSSFALTGNSGFTIYDTSNKINGNGQNYIYMAIRRGPLAPPESATEVFDPIVANNSAGTFNTTGFPVDLQIFKPYTSSTQYWFVNDRLRGVETLPTQTGTSGPYLSTNTTNAEVNNYLTMGWDNEGFRTPSGGFPNTDVVYYNWKRAPGYFDAVAYTGNSTAGRTVSHNLGVAPEMMWIKRRNAAENWAVYHSALGNNKVILLQSSGAPYSDSAFNNTTPTDSVFSVSNATETNASGSTYIAYLFASLDGISKVGSYTGNDGTQTIDCGFTSGARFILIKRTDKSKDWFVWDTARGINVASDPFLTLNTTDAESPGQDEIDAHASGFIINSPGGSGDAEINKSGGTYIFYAIA